MHRKLGNIREERKAKKRLDLPENQEKPSELIPRNS